jgi:hypothetical protein
MAYRASLCRSRDVIHGKQYMILMPLCGKDSHAATRQIWAMVKFFLLRTYYRYATKNSHPARRGIWEMVKFFLLITYCRYATKNSHAATRRI